MKIVHICIQSPYNDYWGYQDNLLPKYQKKLGHDVTIITANRMHKNSQIVILRDEEYEKDYFLSDGQRIIRIKGKNFGIKKMPYSIWWFPYFEILEKIRPDFIMVHGVGNFSSIQVVKYLKKVNPSCKVIADNHLDYNIGKIDSKLKAILYCLQKEYNKLFIYKHYSKIYGVTPWRVEYMQEVFGVPKEKSDLLVMGADDEKINFKSKKNNRKIIRNELGLLDDDFVIITGGKIEANKNVEKLMQAVIDIDNKKIKLIVFGKASNDMKEEIEKLSQNSLIVNIGWIDANKVYDYFLVSDLAIFPGQHSVLWEQVCACGIPALFKEYKGMDHVNVKGSSAFINGDSTENIKENILDLYNNKEKYNFMKTQAEIYGTKTFMYSEIANKSLEVYTDSNLED